MIRLSHTIFALPFALAALILILRNDLIEFEWINLLFLLIAFTGMRSFAMAYNRLVDSDIDARNPRTENRAIPAGILSQKAVMIFAGLSLLVMALSALAMSSLAFWLSFPAAIIIAGYSHAKRFTYFCHLWLGLAIGLAPPAVYLALTETVPITAFLLMFILATYIAGFDILYSLQDMEFDRANGLHSVPARFGVKGALIISVLLHLLSVSGLVFLWKWESLSYTYLIGAFIGAIVIGEEHRIVGWGENVEIEKIPIAFFNYNSVFSILFFVIILADWIFPMGLA